MIEKYSVGLISSARGKSLLVLLLSLGFGAAGVYYARQYVEQQIVTLKNEYETQDAMLEVVVPNRSLKQGDIVYQEDLSIREIPEKYADRNSVNSGNYQAAIGQRIDFDVDEGRPLLWAHLAGGTTPTFSGLIEDGLRAMTVRVDDINSISGFLQPHDKVDLLLTYGGNEDQKIFPLIQNLNVIATGTQTQIDKAADGVMRNFATITVHVTPLEAQKITLAKQVGKLTATLRNPADSKPLSSDAMSIAKLLNIKSVEKPNNTKTQKLTMKLPEPAIEYIVGGQ
jgi:pilus assembly protein CpaB